MWKVSLFIAAIALYWVWPRDDFDPRILAGKRVLITGASSGIGEHLAYEYSKLGARVMIAARREDRLKNVARKCLDLGAQQAEIVVVDMAKVNDRDRLAKEVRNRLEGLDVLILNHAVSNSAWWQGSNQTKQIIQDFEVNFVSYVDIAARTLPLLTESNGSVGIVSSVAGKVPIPMAATYCSSKFALQGFFHSVKQELLVRGVDISITLAVIGPVDTDMMAEPQDNFGWKIFSLVMETPQRSAEAILRGVTTKQSEIHFGRVAYFMVWLNILFPNLSELFWAQLVQLW